ncbi:FecR family protein [Paucibacter sp. XJ19-41]|uniref:FecR family protein n=1 Tax=Paucibacter sp. XJ19-41 TaxID=2927824 RepID=UPI00234B09A8|nr:FecR domain-containing protein [Paucibacter sp. XJ19-41]MDC6169760.1 FecR domain-containing protein [Paucibacter sp. XJ19-41]
MPLKPSERLIEHGLRLITKAEVEAPEVAERARQDLARWRSLSPDHEAAAIEALRRWQVLGGMVAELRDRFDEPAVAPVGRRQALRTLTAMAGCAVLAGTAGAWYWRQPVSEQSYETGTAQLRSVDLLDQGAESSRLDLNAKTRARVRLYRHQRVVTLFEGETRIDVAPDASRPFIVETRVGTLTVLGTAFTVKDRGGPVSIHVEHGHVRFQPSQQSGDPGQSSVDLRAGQAVTLRHGLVGPVSSTLNPQLASAWREGWLVFDNIRLDEALPAINAHRTHAIIPGDPQVAALPLTGRFKADDSASLLQALPSILPLRIVARTDGRIELRSTVRQ